MSNRDNDKLIKNALLFIFLRDNNNPIKDKLIHIKKSLDGGADVNAADFNDGGNTPLHVAVRCGETAFVRLLLDKGADVTRKNWNGDTPFDIAQTLYIEDAESKEEFVNLLQTPDRVANDNSLHISSQSVKFLNNKQLRLESEKTVLTDQLLEIDAAQQQNRNRYIHLDLGWKLHATGIIKLLRTDTKFAKDKALPSNDSSQTHVVSSKWTVSQTLHSISQNDIPDLKTELQPEFQYLKRTGTAGVKGHLFETKLCCLYYIKLRKDPLIEQFYLGTNIRGIGDMDDICLRYQIKGQDTPIVLFVQAKHKENGSLSVDDVRSASGDCSIYKYFECYLTIKDRFSVNNKDPIFEGHFSEVNCFFVILTTAKDNFTKKKPDVKINENVLSLLNTGHNANIFQYDYNEDDINTLTKMTVKKQIMKLGVVFLKLIMRFEHKSSALFMDELMKKYHVVLRREVLQECTKQPNNKEYRNWEFRLKFFESNCEYLVALKNALFKELSTKRCDVSEFSVQDRKNLKEALDVPCAYSYSKLIGKLVTYNEKTKKMHFFESALKKIQTDVAYKALFERFNEIEIEENVIHEAIRIKLISMEIKLPITFGNIDMTFHGSEDKVLSRITYVVKNLTKLLELNKDTKVVELNDDFVGPRKTIERGIIDINGGIGSAVGNLLVLDTKTKMLRIDLENKALPHHAALFLKELKDDKYKHINKELHKYRFKVCVQGFPKDSFYGDENDENQARDYLSKLWYGVNQAKEDKVELIVKNLIMNHCTNQKEANMFSKIDYIFLKYHDEILKWWMATEWQHFPALKSIGQVNKINTEAKDLKQ